jgi:cystathionine beta-lyase
MYPSLNRQNIYGGTYNFVKETMKKFGIEVTILSDSSVQSYKNAIKKNTKLIYMETPSNPLLKITDIGGVVSVGKERKKNSWSLYFIYIYLSIYLL